MIGDLGDVGMGMGAATATAASTTTPAPAPAPAPATTIEDTITAGLSLWLDPLTAVQEIPTLFQALFVSGYQQFAIGGLIPVALLAVVLVGSLSGGGEGKRH